MARIRGFEAGLLVTRAARRRVRAHSAGGRSLTGAAGMVSLSACLLLLLLLLLLLRDAAASGQEGERANEHLASQADLLLVLMLQLLCAAPL